MAKNQTYYEPVPFDPVGLKAYNAWMSEREAGFKPVTGHAARFLRVGNFGNGRYFRDWLWDNGCELGNHNGTTVLRFRTEDERLMFLLKWS